MFKQLTDKINYHELETQVLAFWEENRIFAKSVSTREGRPTFTFYEGPPTANGRPGIHHVMSRTLKDLVCRYKTMRGFQVHRKAGWDTHGLPVEIEVEKELGFKHKDEIVKYGIAEFNKKCKESVWKYKTDWEQMTRMMGYWVDLDHPYITFENSYIESIWWALKQYYDKGMIYKGYKIQPYCPRCETPLSSHEVSLGYKDVKDPSVYVKMKVKGEENTYFLVWTTTPWTLISNVALAVHPDVDYVKAEYKGEKLILAEARLSVLADEYSVVEKFKGSSLAGREYERLFNYHTVSGKGWYVVTADFVTTEDGSGIVHMAPAYGEDDYQMGKKYNLPTIHPVNKSGEFGPEVKDFAGMFVKDADPEIVANLKRRGLLFKKESYLHSYPHCWRCSSPLLYYARDSWYIRTTAYAQRMIDLNKTINWVPKETGTGRFGNWLEENKDWALSRDRFWGTPLPIWICEQCGEQKCVGSVAELKAGKNVPEPLDLHKPYVDEVIFDCPKCSGTMKRTPELIDVWFDSGSMPFAQWHYPFENTERFERSYPADYISEGIDQTRGWFYTLHAIGTFLFDKPAFKSVLVNELILDKQGQKMSKSKGNTVDPFALLQKYGADATRWYLVSNSPVWRPTLFDEDGVAEVQRKFFSTLINTYSFFALYANVDGFTPPTSPAERIPVRERPEIDRWILSELNSLLEQYLGWMEEYDVTRAARAINDFTIDRLSNWYVRRNRRRFWKSEKGKDKTAAYQTLHECLLTVCKMIAPFAPFIADELFRNLHAGSGEESVHLSMLPEVDKHAIDVELERKMERAIRIVSLVRAMRMRSNLKVRQPLKRIILPVSNDRQRMEIEELKEMILEEINVKKIEYVGDDSDIVRKKAKPNFKTLGPKFGKHVQAIAARIRECTAAEITTLEREGSLKLSSNGTEFEVKREDVEVLHEDIKGWLVESDGSVTVALDTELNEELIDEGLAREFVNRVQNMRKDAGFEVTDRIRIYHRSTDRLATALERRAAYIRQETLAVELRKLTSTTDTQMKFQEADINGEQAQIAVEKV
ncbi:MAG TPA: isoleucine--tRNA ligase [Bacteroidota bacterium]|nr:isoleucine--tRNA ligase [Bacteroidota bacterium]